MRHATDATPHEEIVKAQSLSGPLPLIVEIIKNKQWTTTNHLNTPPTSQFSRLHNGGQLKSTDYTTFKDNSYYPDQSSRDKWQSWGWKDYSKNPSSSHQSTGVDYKKSSHPQPNDSTTKPLTAFSSTQQAPKGKTCPLW